MVELGELSQNQAHQYVLLHLDNIDEYHRFVRITISDRHISFNTKKIKISKILGCF